MDPQMVRPHGHGHDQEPHVAGHQMEGEDEHHHEKTSVMQKVKAKARKIKDTLTKHGHGHNPDHDHDLDEEDDDYEDDTSEDPEFHGAPIYDSVDKKNVGVTNAGRSTAMDVDPLPPAPAPALGNVKPYAGGHYHEEEGSKSHPGATLVYGEAPMSPQNTPVSHTTADYDHDHTRDRDPARTFVPGQETHSGQPQVNLQRPKGGLLEDPAALKATTPGADRSSNYQTKVADPSGIGGGEAEVGSVISSFNKMGMDESKPKSTGQELNRPTGTEDFYTSLPTGSHDQFSPEVTPPKPVTRTEDHPRGDIGGDIGSTDESFGSPKDNVANRQSNQSSYTGKISSATSAIANTAISAKNVVASKLGYGQQGDIGGHEAATEKPGTTTSTGSEKDHGVGGQESNQNQSTYAGKISSAAISAKNVVASKLGYGGEQGEAGGHDTTTVTEKTGTAGTGIEKEHGIDGQDKGVSVKDYLAEKLRPGEEDKALSELISETFHKKEDKPLSPRPVTEAINDAFYNRHEEPQEEASRPMGKVTESEEVARRLGTTEVDPSKVGSDSSFVDNSGTTASTGMVDKIKGAVGSWFGGKGEDSQNPQQPHSAPTDSAFDEAGHKN